MLSAEKGKEIAALREQSQRLQVQLNNGHSGFADFKEKKAKEILELKNTIENLKAIETNNPEKMTDMELSGLRQSLEVKTQEVDSLMSEREALVGNVNELLAKSKNEVQENEALKLEVKDLKEQMDDLTKTCDSRKNLLDEMKDHIEKTNSETDVVRKEVVQLKTTIQERDIEIEGLKEDMKRSNAKETSLVAKINVLESREAELDIEVNTIKSKAVQDMNNIKEHYQDEMKIIQAEHEINVRDLNMQLEIANAQTSEFEETIEQMKQENKDQAEEKKIGDKKVHSLIKDLKKQLLAEKQRNEKLSEKIKEHFAEPSQSSLSGN